VSPAAALLLAALPALGALTEERGLSAPARAEIERLTGTLRRSATFRRLEAATRHLPRREARGSGLELAVDARGGDAPVLVFDAERLPRYTEAEALVSLARALARAELAFPLAAVEAEQAAWQNALRALCEAAQGDAALSRALDGAYRAAAPLLQAAAREGAQSPERLPPSPLARAGLFLRLFEKDPALFHRAVEASLAPGALRLAELEDLFALRAKELAALRAPPQGPYAELGGRRYDAALVRAAYRLRGTGELERLRETLAAFESAGALETREAFAAWRRGAR
jgi:hypothetical protein